MEQLELTPVDIRHKEFPTGLAGYKKEEVREFLELVAHQMEDLQGRCTTLADENKQLEATRDEWHKAQQQPVIEPEEQFAEPLFEPEPEPILEPEPEPEPEPIPEPEHKPAATEDLISRTLILAEKTKQEILDKAERDAENIVFSAELRAEKILEQARGQLQVLLDQYNNIKNRKKDYLSHFRNELGKLKDHLDHETQELIDSLNRDTLLRPEFEHALDAQFAELQRMEPQDDQQPEEPQEEHHAERPPLGID